MKRKVVTALALALTLAIVPLSGQFATIATASSNNTVETGSNNNTESGSGNNTVPDKDDNNQNDDNNNNQGGNQDDNNNQGGGNQDNNNNQNGGNQDNEVIVTDPSDSAGEEASTGTKVTVTTSTGATISSTIATTNTSTDIKSVAMATAQSQVNRAAGLTAERLERGDYVKLTIAASQCGEVARQAITNAAMSVRGTVATYMEINLDILNRNGAPIEGLTQLASAVNITISVPENVENASNYDFAVVRLHDGKTDILPDIDSDPSTITFASDKFSVYAVIYGEKGSFDSFKSAAKKDSVPKTGDTLPNVLPVAAAGVIFAAAAIVLKKKEK